MPWVRDGDWDYFAAGEAPTMAAQISYAIWERQIHSGWGTLKRNSNTVGTPAEVWPLVWESALDKGYTGPAPWFWGFLLWDRPPILIGQITEDLAAGRANWQVTFEPAAEYVGFTDSIYPVEIQITPTATYVNGAEKMGVVNLDAGHLWLCRKDTPPTTAHASGSYVWLVSVPYLAKMDFAHVPIAAAPNKEYDENGDWTGNWTNWGKWTGVHMYDFIRQAREHALAIVGSRVYENLDGYTPDHDVVAYPPPAAWIGQRTKLRGCLGYWDAATQTFYGDQDDTCYKPYPDGSGYFPVGTLTAIWQKLAAEYPSEYPPGTTWIELGDRTGGTWTGIDKKHPFTTFLNPKVWTQLRRVISKLNAVRTHISPGEPEYVSTTAGSNATYAAPSGNQGYGLYRPRPYAGYVNSIEHAYLARSYGIGGDAGTALFKNVKAPYHGMIFTPAVGCFLGYDYMQAYPPTRPLPEDFDPPTGFAEAVAWQITSSTYKDFPTRLLKGALLTGRRGWYYESIKEREYSWESNPIYRPNFSISVSDSYGDVEPNLIATIRQAIEDDLAYIPTYAYDRYCSTTIHTGSTWPQIGVDTPGPTLNANITEGIKADGSPAAPWYNWEGNMPAVPNGRCIMFLACADFVSNISAYTDDDLPRHYPYRYTVRFTAAIVQPSFVYD